MDFATIYDDTLVCDCCQRKVDYVRGSAWHADNRLCCDCFRQWYDPDNATFDPTDPISLGNYVRSKHGLAPMPPQQET